MSPYIFLKNLYSNPLQKNKNFFVIKNYFIADSNKKNNKLKEQTCLLCSFQTKAW